MQPDRNTRGGHGDAVAPSDDFAAGGVPQWVVPLAKEVLQVSKRMVEIGGVRILLQIETVEDLLRDTVRTQHAEINRVPTDREVSEAPQTGRDGDVRIVPVVDENRVCRTAP